MAAPHSGPESWELNTANKSPALRRDVIDNMTTEVIPILQPTADLDMEEAAPVVKAHSIEAGASQSAGKVLIIPMSRPSQHLSTNTLSNG